MALLGTFVLAVAASCIAASVLTWLRGDVVGRWMVLGTVPLALAVLYALARSLGWVNASWFTDYSIVAALLLNMPMALAGLNSRSHERRSAHLRQRAAELQDPLTGLPKAKVFYARVRHALARHAAMGESAAIVFVELSNLDAIKGALGGEAAEESLLRAVIKLRALLRDIDTAGRIGEARFGIVLEGVGSRDKASDFASRLVAAGLMQDPDAPPGSVLRFHTVIALLTEFAPPADQLLRDMAVMLGTMGPRTKRPIRFVTADELRTIPTSLEGLELDVLLAH